MTNVRLALPPDRLSKVIGYTNQIYQMRDDYHSHNYNHIHTTFVVHPLHVVFGDGLSNVFSLMWAKDITSIQ